MEISGSVDPIKGEVSGQVLDVSWNTQGLTSGDAEAPKLKFKSVHSLLYLI